MLNVPTPPASSYYSRVALANDGSRPAIWHIEIMEYVVIAVLHFPADARDGAVDFTSRTIASDRDLRVQTCNNAAYQD